MKRHPGKEGKRANDDIINAALNEVFYPQNLVSRIFLLEFSPKILVALLI